MNNYLSMLLPDNGAAAVPLLKLKMAVVGSPVDSRPTKISDAHECLLVKSTQCVEIYKAHITSDDDRKLMALVLAKVFRVLPNDQHNDKTMKFLRNQSITATRRSFLAPVVEGSITVGEFVYPAAVAPCYSNGNVSDYISRNPDVQRMVLVEQMAVGLAHVHAKGMIHGNFCPENVCITDDGEVRITDIGTDIFLRGIDESGKLPERWRYKPSEELDHGIRTTQTDVYSFASTVYSMHTGSAMFPSGSTYALNVIAVIIERGHIGIFGACEPAAGIGEGLWEIIKMCWAQDPSRRPSMAEVVDRLLKPTSRDRTRA